jgi:signal transduction histidine kinase
LRSEFPFKTDFVHALLRRTVGHNRTDSLFPEGPLLSIEAPGRGCVAVSDEDFSEVEVAKKSHLAVTLLEEDLRPKLKNAAAALGFLVERWKLPVLDIQTARPETKITLLSNILVGDDALERLQLGVEEIGSRFAFATPPKIARMPSIEKMLLWIALGKQDRSMSAFEDFVLQAVVKPLRMGTMDAFARLLRPSQEAEEEMFRIYADRITRLLSEYSTRNEVCEELVMKGKDHVASLIFDQTGGVHVQDREAIGELMKTGPVGRVMRKEAEWNRQRRIEIEKNATFENTRLIRRLLELSRLDEEGREAFRSHVEDHITREDRSCFDVGGLSARRIRELLNGAADAVAPHLPAVWADEPAATA